MNTIYVIGIGPGNADEWTRRAQKAMEESQVIVGYGTYIELVKPYFPNKQFVTTGMTKEVDRCKMVLQLALEGQRVALISSGDAGVYGMAGLMYEVAAGIDGIVIEVIPGITAACSGAAIVGAPLVNDFCVISLSDLLTPWDVIEKRLACAGEGDFTLCLYNPGSKKRIHALAKACAIVKKYRSLDTPTAVVRNIGRDGEAMEIMTLKELSEYHADMFTTVYIGNSQTSVLDGHIVTKRGYTLI